MKRIFVIAPCLLIFTLFSCQFTEDIYINEDGSGRMAFALDASELMNIAGDELKKEALEDIDSTIVFKEFIALKKDSISRLDQSHQKLFSSIEPLVLHTYMNSDSKALTLDLSREFQDVAEIEDMFAAMHAMQTLNNDTGEEEHNPFTALNSQDGSSLDYTYDGELFERVVRVYDDKKHQKVLTDLQTISQYFGTSKYKVNYHFSKPVIAVSNSDARISADKKTVSINYNYLDYLQNPEALNLEVLLEE
ncbi:MAG: hypothetical protein BM564_08065 [Bacteroidetes bacterium MedPE-SWsnd-G2]|nr:MAG: hypothetical protein BM564_08065 [Bacteroidetes bacterium MedPE-SWsnd-G2]